VVLAQGRGCIDVVDDKGHDDERCVPPLVSSSSFFVFAKTQETHMLEARVKQLEKQAHED
jgi:hypothetical protein